MRNYTPDPWASNLMQAIMAAYGDAALVTALEQKLPPARAFDLVPMDLVFTPPAVADYTVKAMMTAAFPAGFNDALKIKITASSKVIVFGKAWKSFPAAGTQTLAYYTNAAGIRNFVQYWQDAANAGSYDPILFDQVRLTTLGVEWNISGWFLIIQP